MSYSGSTVSTHCLPDERNIQIRCKQFKGEDVKFFEQNRLNCWVISEMMYDCLVPSGLVKSNVYAQHITWNVNCSDDVVLSTP